MTTTDFDVKTDVQRRVDELDWDAVTAQLDTKGHAVTPAILSPAECDELADMFDGGPFAPRSIWLGTGSVMVAIGTSRIRCPTGHGARVSFYPHLAPVANRWADLLSGENPTFPSTLDQLLARCHAVGQTRPTPLMLRYREGDWNALHQDLYGEVFFPFQVFTVLSHRDDFDGGEFV